MIFKYFVESSVFSLLDRSANFTVNLPLLLLLPYHHAFAVFSLHSLLGFQFPFSKPLFSITFGYSFTTVVRCSFLPSSRYHSSILLCYFPSSVLSTWSQCFVLCAIEQVTSIRFQISLFRTLLSLISCKLLRIYYIIS